jgi:ribonuclease J
VGTVIHSGDFKLDPQPRDGVCSDLERLKELGDDGVAMLMSDSTNVLSAGSSTSEGVVAETLETLVAAAPHRVVVGLFASNIHRVDAVAQAAQAAGRRLCLLGRSVRDHVRVARGLGVLDWRSDLLTSPELARKLPREEVVYIASGTQGQSRSALRRIAGRTHHELRLEAGDEVLLSSRIIPGNERSVVAMVDALLAQGVAVRSRITVPLIHASGHAHREELRRFLEAVRPRSFIPLHGTRLHLSRHAELAREVGVTDVMSLHDGETARLDGDGLHGDAPIASGRVATAFGDALDDEVIRQRRQIGRAGIVVVAVSDDRVLVSLRGVPQPEEGERRALLTTRRILAEAGEPVSPADLQERIRRAVRNQIADMIGYKPLVEVNVWADKPN